MERSSEAPNHHFLLLLTRSCSSIWDYHARTRLKTFDDRGGRAFFLLVLGAR